MAMKLDYARILRAIADDIAGLKAGFPQLSEFSPARDLDLERLTLSYGYHTHAPRHRGGWTSGVPNPEEDGVWFHLDFHEPDSQAQIHTQPVVPRITLGEKRVCFLILEGAKTKPLAGRVRAILKAHGAADPVK